MHTGIILAAWAVSGLLPSAPETSPASSARSLVQQLGSAKYREREAAAARLLKMGRAAVEALSAGRSSSDPEVSNRCQQLLPQAKAFDLAQRLDHFVADKEGLLSHDLPWWKELRVVIGDDPKARGFYATMVRSCGTMLESTLEDPSQMTERLTMRAQEMYFDIYGNPFAGFRGEVPPGRYDPSEVAAMMLMMTSAHYKPTQPDWLFSSVYGSPGPFLDRLKKDDSEGTLYRKVFFHHVTARMDDNTLNQVVYLLAQYRIPGSAEVFVKALADKKATQMYTKAQVIAGLATIGTKEHAKSLEPFLKDTTSVQPFFVGRGGQQGTVRMQDIALASIIHLHGKDPKAFGFAQWRLYPGQMIPYHQLGFSTDEERKVAFEKWGAETKSKPASK